MALKEEEKNKVEVENQTWIFNIGILTKLFLPFLIITMEEFLFLSYQCSALTPSPLSPPALPLPRYWKSVDAI